MSKKASYIWFNGELRDQSAAQVPFMTAGLHYGIGVFEGIRAYETDRGPAVFRLTEHMQRLHDSAKLLYLDLPYTVDELKAATWEVIGANGLPSCYLRPLALSGYAQLGVASRNNPIDDEIMSSLLRS